MHLENKMLDFKIKREQRPKIEHSHISWDKVFNFSIALKRTNFGQVGWTYPSFQNRFTASHVARFNRAIKYFQKVKFRPGILSLQNLSQEIGEEHISVFPAKDFKI